MHVSPLQQSRTVVSDLHWDRLFTAVLGGMIRKKQVHKREVRKGEGPSPKVRGWWWGHLLGKRAWAWELRTSLCGTKLGWRVWAARAWGPTAGIVVTPVTPTARGVEGGLGVAPVNSDPDELLIAAAKEKEVNSLNGPIRVSVMGLEDLFNPLNK